MRTIRAGIAMLLVTVGGLAIPRSADACSVAMTTLADREALEVVASVEAELMESEPGSCYGITEVWFYLYLDLQTPADVEYDYDYVEGFPWAHGSVILRVTIDSYEGGWGTYVATSRIDQIDYLNPWPMTWYGPYYQFDDYFVSWPSLALDGPSSTQQHSGIYVSASLDPTFLAPAIQWQGCTPQQGNLSCYFPASAQGQYVITASITNGPSEQWPVYVNP